MAINSTPPSVADLERTIAQYEHYIRLLENRVDELERLTEMFLVRIPTKTEEEL